MATARRIELTKETRGNLTTRPLPSRLRFHHNHDYQGDNSLSGNRVLRLMPVLLGLLGSYRRSTPPPPRCLSRARSTLACPISLSWHASLEELSHRLLSTMHCRGHCCSK